MTSTRAETSARPRLATSVEDGVEVGLAADRPGDLDGGVERVDGLLQLDALRLGAGRSGGRDRWRAPAKSASRTAASSSSSVNSAPDCFSVR